MIVISTSLKAVVALDPTVAEENLSPEVVDWLETRVGRGQVLNIRDITGGAIKKFFENGHEWVAYISWVYDPGSMLMRRAAKVHFVFPHDSTEAAMLFKLTWGGA